MNDVTERGEARASDREGDQYSRCAPSRAARPEPPARSAEQRRRPSRNDIPRGLIIVEWASWALWGGAWALAGYELSIGAFGTAAVAGVWALGVAIVRDTARDYAREHSIKAQALRDYEFTKGFREGFAAGDAYAREALAFKGEE